jgi:hypothetical protein
VLSALKSFISEDYPVIKEHLLLHCPIIIFILAKDTGPEDGWPEKLSFLFIDFLNFGFNRDF